jgi:hypothetical protein
MAPPKKRFVVAKNVDGVVEPVNNLLLSTTFDPDGVADVGISYSKAVSGRVELHYVDDTGTPTQITSNGTVNGGGGGGGGGGGTPSLVPTSIKGVDYTVQPGELALMDSSAAPLTATLANGTADGQRIGVVYYFNGTTPGFDTTIAGTISSSTFDVNSSVNFIGRAAGKFKSVIFVWSATNGFWVLESSSQFTPRVP